MAHFYSARLYGKKIVAGNRAKRVEMLNLALAEYVKMVETADRHTKHGYKLDVPEVELAREMSQLLKVEISRTPLVEDAGNV